ncbi:MAG: hypothetical protein J1E64_15275 [Acetatifactor sp.]|nr:hypothetical protein [Acetatifactor sp.]
MILTLALFGLTSCTPNNFSPEQEASFLAEAEKVASDYFADHYSDAKVTEIHSETVYNEGWYDLTSYAGGQFIWHHNTYNFVVNAETGAVYTSILWAELVELLQDEILQRLSIDAREVSIISCSVYIGNSIIDVPGIQNVFPEGETAENAFQKIMQNTGEYNFSSIILEYKGEELSRKILEQGFPFPNMTLVRIYHIGDEHEFCYGSSISYSILPSVSEEFLNLSSSWGLTSYTKNQVLEQDGFQVVYSAYKWTDRRDVATEIAEEDITLTVTEEYISLDCAKDDYAMYLSVTDSSTVAQYLYNYNHRTKSATEGKWYAYEHRYYYDGNANNYGLSTPFCFTPEANTIYTEAAIKK